MHLSERVRTHLERLHAPYAVVPHPRTGTLGEAAEASHIDPESMIRAVLLQDEQGLLLTVLPATHLIDFQILRERLRRNLKPAAPDLIAATFPDCEAGCVPPLGAPYGLTAVIDEGLARSGHVHFEAGFRDSLIRMQGYDFRSLHTDSLHAPVARPVSVLESRDIRDFMLPGELNRHHPLTALRPHEDIRRIVEKVDRLPSMPEMANRLLRLCNDPHAGIQELTDVIQYDPSLTAQIIRYARSAFFGFRGNIDTLPQAITRVLGFETVLNMSLGLAASRTFHNPADGPLGLQSFWRHAAYSAALAQALAKAIGPRLPLKPGIAYLAGLLHNFGFLLAGHLFRAEFFLLNRVVAANPQVPVPLIERRVLGVDHAEMGAWLMQAWNMPEAVIVACREHHNEAYTGEHAEYAHLILCADHLLRAHNMGDGAEAEPPTTILTALGLDARTAREIAAALFESSDALDAMARQLAA